MPEGVSVACGVCRDVSTDGVCSAVAVGLDGVETGDTRCSAEYCEPISAAKLQFDCNGDAGEQELDLVGGQGEVMIAEIPRNALNLVIELEAAANAQGKADLDIRRANSTDPS